MIVEAEEAAKDDKPQKPLTPAQLRAKAKEEEIDGLCNRESIEYYILWHSMGGSQRGLSPVEILEMPAWLRMDFSTISRYTAEEHDRVKRNKPKKPKPRGRH